MAKQVINIGRTANDRSGDPLRTAFSKVNDNFTELYSAIGADVQIPIQTNNGGKYLTTNGSTLSWATVAIPTDLNQLADADGLLVSSVSELTNGSKNVRLGTDGILTMPNGGTFNNTSIINSPSGTIHTFNVDADGNASGIDNINEVWIATTAESIAIQPGWIITFKNGQQKTVVSSVAGIMPPHMAQHQLTWSGNITLTSADVWPLTVQSADYTTGVNITKLEITPEGTTTWTFDSDGVIKLPVSGDIVDSTGVSVLGAPTVIDGGNASTTF